MTVPPLAFFLLLQLCDVVTTLVGFKLGLGEGNPVVRSILPAMGPIWGVLATKTMALSLVLACLLLKRKRTISKINRWYIAVVCWNFVNICYVLVVHPWGKLPFSS